MSNDRKASELLSKSFHGGLDPAEQEALSLSMTENEETEKYVTLSRLIQESVADVVVAAESGDPSIAPGLSDAARERLRDSVRQAKVDSVAGTMLEDIIPAGLDISLAQPGDERDSLTRFTFLRQIGEGGLGTVWLARDEHLKRTVAIKEIKPEKAATKRHMERFQREATITGLLEHPNVVPLYMYGINRETNTPFYAMRFLGKQTLADAIHEYHARRNAGQTESIDLHRLLTVFLDVCQAIAYAHSRGVVHRDLKPENVALDNFGQVIVLDWGIAKLLSDGEMAIQSSMSSEAHEEGLLTRTMAGEVVGTPLYMAPEQARGDLDSVDERTDVYGLGAILFSILSGQAPHQNSAERSSGDGFSDILKVIAEGDLPSLAELNPSAPHDLVSICMRAMSKQRYTRHGSARDLADDVEHWMAGQTEKRKRYEAMRLEGHNLRSHLDSAIQSFATNVRFMSTLPPIQGLIDSANDQDEEGETVWRERLTTIFRGLLKSNPGFVAVTYSRVIDSQTTELVRVEKPSPESEARKIPKSRLRTASVCSFGDVVMRKKPEDVHVAISPCPDTAGCVAPLRIAAGVPVFDREEEPFGMVTIEGDFDRLIASQVQIRNRASAQVLIVDDAGKVLVEDAEDTRGIVGKNARELMPEWSEIERELSLNNSYVDAGAETFATHVFLVPRMSSLSLVLLAG